MESVILASIAALQSKRILPGMVANWINYGDEYLENPQLHETLPTKRNRDELFYLAQAAGQAMFNLGITTTESVTLYHGTYDEYQTGTLTSRIFPLSESIRVAEEFGDHLYQVTIPPGTPCFYVSAYNIYDRSFPSLTERRKYLRFHSEEELIIPQGQLTITGSRSVNFRSLELPTDADFETLDDYVYNPILADYHPVTTL